MSNTSYDSNITPLDFVLTGLDVSIAMDTSAGLVFGNEPSMDASAGAVIYVKTSDMRKVFQFQTDASDVDSEASTDIQYYVNMDQWPSDLVLNPSQAMMNKSTHGSYNPIATVASSGQSYSPDRMLVKHDYIRYLALKLFNTHYGVDLFSNEDNMKEDLTSKGHNTWQNDISANLHTAYTNGPYTNNDTGRYNFSREILHFIVCGDRDRLVSDSSSNGTIQHTEDKQPLPLIDGDKISFKITIHPATDQHLLTNAATIPSRSYHIQLYLTSDTNLLNTKPSDTNTNTALNTSYAYYNTNGRIP